MLCDVSHAWVPVGARPLSRRSVVLHGMVRGNVAFALSPSPAPPPKKNKYQVNLQYAV